MLLAIEFDQSVIVGEIKIEREASLVFAVRKSFLCLKLDLDGI